MKRRWISIGILAAALAIQWVPVERTNPPDQDVVPAPPEVRAVLERSCYDCHSNRTRWPWYSHVAPVSWLVAWDVGEARRHLNFTTWNRYDYEKRLDILQEVFEEVDEGNMPLWYYLPLHPEARLTPEDVKAIEAWARSGGFENG